MKLNHQTARPCWLYGPGYKNTILSQPNDTLKRLLMTLVMINILQDVMSKLLILLFMDGFYSSFFYLIAFGLRIKKVLYLPSKFGRILEIKIIFL